MFYGWLGSQTNARLNVSLLLRIGFIFILTSFLSLARLLQIGEHRFCTRGYGANSLGVSETLMYHRVIWFECSVLCTVRHLLHWTCNTIMRFGDDELRARGEIWGRDLSSISRVTKENNRIACDLWNAIQLESVPASKGWYGRTKAGKCWVLRGSIT
jgi:hypothetical protein